MERLRRLADLQSLDVPLIVLIGGSTGTGKSTVAAEVAHRLGITRVTSTDFIRQTMRAFFSEEFMPTIHRSSFEAGEAMVGDVKGDPTVAGFVDQSRPCCVGVEAAIRRALTEGWSMVLEGVHLVPGLVPTEIEGALVVHVIVAITRRADAPPALPRPGHRDRRVPADGQVPRPARRDPDAADASVERAIRVGIPVVENANVERTTTRSSSSCCSPPTACARPPENGRARLASGHAQQRRGGRGAAPGRGSRSSGWTSSSSGCFYDATSTART